MTRFSAADYLESETFPFHLDFYRLSRGQIVPSHSHEFVEFVYVAEGRGRHQYQGRWYPIEKGDCFVIQPEAEHAYDVDGESGMQGYNVLFQPSVFAKEIETLSQVTPFVDFFYVEPFLRGSVDFQSHLRLEPHESMELQLLLERLRVEYEHKALGYRILIITRLIEMFVYLSRCYDRRIHKPISAYAGEQEAIRHICGLIAQHHAKPLTLPQVSRLCGMSPSTFTAKFKQHVGKTFIEYRNDVRIRVAQGLLRDTDDKIIAIAAQVGFEDISFFNRAFKQAVGMSPGDYRQRERGNKRPADISAQTESDRS